MNTLHQNSPACHSPHDALRDAAKLFCMANPINVGGVAGQYDNYGLFNALTERFPKSPRTGFPDPTSPETLQRFATTKASLQDLFNIVKRLYGEAPNCRQPGNTPAAPTRSDLSLLAGASDILKGVARCYSETHLARCGAGMDFLAERLASLLVRQVGNSNVSPHELSSVRDELSEMPRYIRAEIVQLAKRKIAEADVTFEDGKRLEATAGYFDTSPGQSTLEVLQLTAAFNDSNYSVQVIEPVYDQYFFYDLAWAVRDRLTPGVKRLEGIATELRSLGV